MFMPARSLFTVARPCGNLTRFPFHPPDLSGENLETSLGIPYRCRQVKRSTLRATSGSLSANRVMLRTALARKISITVRCRAEKKELLRDN
jgi:hypothetical protein